MAPESRNQGKILAVTGAVLQLGPVLGVIGTVLGMCAEFEALESQSSGSSDPEQASAAIGYVLIPTIVGSVLGIGGILLLCIALFRSRYRAKWFFWFLAVYGALLILAFPIGTVFGVLFLIICRKHRGEFGV